MCLIAFSWRADPRYRLVVVANRDEYFRRAAAPAAFWADYPHVLAGRDLEAGGTWLGITRDGRFAALTNYRDPAEKKNGAPSRGALVSGYLAGRAAPGEYLRAVESRAAEYSGFSLLVGDAGSMFFFSNRGGGAVPVSPGLHALSNHLLDTPWPKIERARTRLARQLEEPFDAEAAFRLLDDTERAPSGKLPSTGISLEWEERLSAIRILASGGYGTRCSTVLCLDENGEMEFHERSYGEDGSVIGTVSHRLKVEPEATRVAFPHAGSPPPGTSLPTR